MTAEETQPKADAWDDGALQPSPDNLLRWRAMRLRLLGTWRPGQKHFYGPSGRRLSRVPSAVRQSGVFQDWDTLPWIDPAEHALVFFQRTGADGYTFVQRCKTCSERHDRGLVVYSVMPYTEPVAGRRRIVSTVIGPVVEDERTAIRFQSCSADENTAFAVPGWGSVFVSRAQPGDNGDTCRLSLAYSSSTVKTDWAVRGLVDDDREIDPTSMSQVCSACAEGDITGLDLEFPVSPDHLRGIVFRPRWHAKVDWGVITIPPAPASGGS